jgi:thiol:disulfide interchange protein DsbC
MQSMLKISLLAAAAAALLPVASIADDPAATELAAVRADLAERYPSLKPENINEGPIPQLFEIKQGSVIAYVTRDGRYLVQGEVIDLIDKRNLTVESANQGRLGLLADVTPESSIVFGPENPTHTVTIFTDIDCTFCRKLHREIDSYVEQGIAVRYMLYPRSGPSTRSWEKAEEVWCAENRQDALTAAKNEQPLPPAECDAGIVAEHFALGQAVGLSGTPAIVTDTGELIGGYVPAAQLAQRLDAAVAAAQRTAAR